MRKEFEKSLSDMVELLKSDKDTLLRTEVCLDSRRSFSFDGFVVFVFWFVFMVKPKSWIFLKSRIIDKYSAYIHKINFSKVVGTQMLDND